MLRCSVEPFEKLMRPSDVALNFTRGVARAARFTGALVSSQDLSSASLPTEPRNAMVNEVTGLGQGMANPDQDGRAHCAMCPLVVLGSSVPERIRRLSDNLATYAVET